MSPRGAIRIGMLGIAACLCSALTAGADEPLGPPKQSLNEVSLEVSALQTLYTMKMTRPQLEKLRKLAKETASKQIARQDGKTSDRFRKTLTDLHTALTKGKDGKQIDKLTDELEELRTTEKPELDDLVEITDEARNQAPLVLRLLSPRQVAYYLGTFADSIPDPKERLLEALAKVRGLSPKEWKEVRDEVSEDVARVMAGIDVDQAADVSDKVVQLLIIARGMKENEFKKQRSELEKKAREIVGDIGPTEVLRHVVGHALAELLSNPRLGNAIEACLKGGVGG